MLHRKIQGNEGNLSTETDMAKTGRPPLEPRIAALEARMAEMEKEVRLLRHAPSQTVRDASAAPLSKEFIERYTPLFDRWPGNGST